MINKKNFQDKDLPHELLLTTRQTTKQLKQEMPLLTIFQQI